MGLEVPKMVQGMLKLSGDMVKLGHKLQKGVQMG